MSRKVAFDASKYADFQCPADISLGLERHVACLDVYGCWHRIHHRVSGTPHIPCIGDPGVSSEEYRKHTHIVKRMLYFLRMYPDVKCTYAELFPIVTRGLSADMLPDLEPFAAQTRAVTDTAAAADS